MSHGTVVNSKLNVFPVIYIDLYPSETRSNVISNLKKLLTFLETNPSFPFSFALTVPSIISLKEHKKVFSRLTALLKEERCSLVGTCYSSSIDRETFPTRHYQITWPGDYYKEFFDIEPKFFWVPDNLVDSVSFSILQEMGYTHCLFDHRIYSQLLSLSSDENNSKTPVTGIWPITDFRLLGVSGLDLTIYGIFRNSSSNVPFFQSIPSPSRLINRLLKQLQEEASVSILGLYFDLNWFDSQFYLPTNNVFSPDSFLIDLLEELKDHEKLNFISNNEVEKASIKEYALSKILPAESFQLLSCSKLSGIHDWKKTPNTVFWHKKAALIEKQLAEAEETIKQMTVSDIIETNKSEKISASELLLKNAWELFLISQSKLGFLGSGDTIGFHNGIISYHKRWERMKLAILYMQASISKLISPSSFSTFEDLLGIGSLQLHAGSSKLSFILSTKYGARITHLFNRETGVIYTTNDIFSENSDFSFSDNDIGIFADNYSEIGFPLYTLANEPFACSELTNNSWIFSKLIANEMIVSKHYELDSSEAIIKLTYGFQNIIDKSIKGEFETYCSFSPDTFTVLKEGSSILEMTLDEDKSLGRIINTKTNNQVEIEVPSDFKCSFEKLTYAIVVKLTLAKLELRPGEEQFYSFKLKFS